MDNTRKDQFLNGLSRGSLPASKSAAQLSMLQEADFVGSSLDTEEYEENSALWSSDYFQKQCGILKLSAFSKKRCKHAVEVKRYLQEKKIKGFLIQLDDEAEPEPVLSPKVAEHSDIQSMITSNSDLLMKYNPSEDFQKAINDKDVEQVKSMLMLYITDIGYSVNDALLSVLYCYQKAPELFEEYEESKFKKPIDLDESAWRDEMYLVNQQIYLNVNFSLERLLHMINVVTYLSNKTSKSRLIKETVTPLSSSMRSSTGSQESHRSSGRRNDGCLKSDAEQDQQSEFIKKVVLIGGAVLAGLALLFTIF